jgi:hypothetical protein
LRNKFNQGLFLEGTAPLSSDAWHHLVAVRDAVTNENRLYIDGRLDCSGEIVYTDGFDSGTAELNIGWLDLGSGFHFNGTLDEVAIYSRALSETEIRSQYYLSRAYTETCTEPVRIMPLGDSITYDNYSGDTRPPGLKTSYRQHLWLSLVDAGYNVDFVGTRIAGQDALPAFDPDNEGYPGWSDDDIASIVYQLLVDSPADVVLLHIGTNWLNSSPDDVEHLLNEIDRYENEFSTDVTVILARIINRIGHICPAGSLTTSFNNNVENMANTRITNGDKIIIADMECSASLDYRAPPDGDMLDLLHPTDSGYAKMADVWMDKLDDILPLCESAPRIVSVPETTASAGRPYSYDVDAIGFPIPAYALLPGAPVDLSINEFSGVIEWSPAGVGNFEVNVMASNDWLPDAIQTFTIHVAEAPLCLPGISHYWKLEESSGPPYSDSCGSNNATCQTCPTRTTGIIRQAQQFDGIDDEISASADDTFDWDASDSFTIEYWMKTQAAATPSGNQVIVGRDDSSSQLHWWTGLWGDSRTAAFILIATSGDGADPVFFIRGTTDLTDGNWHHVVAVRDNSSGQNILYVDGSEEDAKTVTYTTGFESGTAALNIGWLNLSGHYRFNGTLDEVALYDRALTAEEILQHYTAGLTRNLNCAGDFDTDGVVGGSDLAYFAADFGRTDCDTGENCEGNYNTDADLDGSDLAIFAAGFGSLDCF